MMIEEKTWIDGSCFTTRRQQLAKAILNHIETLEMIDMKEGIEFDTKLNGVRITIYQKYIQE